jgi:hypothetical protein
MGLCASKKAVEKVVDPFDNPRRKGMCLPICFLGAKSSTGKYR